MNPAAPVTRMRICALLCRGQKIARKNSTGRVQGLFLTNASNGGS
jgi:hypothetical protein